MLCSTRRLCCARLQHLGLTSKLFRWNTKEDIDDMLEERHSLMEHLSKRLPHKVEQKLEEHAFVREMEQIGFTHRLAYQLAGFPTAWREKALQTVHHKLFGKNTRLMAHSEWREGESSQQITITDGTGQYTRALEVNVVTDEQWKDAQSAVNTWWLDSYESGAIASVQEFTEKKKVIRFRDVHALNHILTTQYPNSWFHVTWSEQVNDCVLQQEDDESSDQAVGWRHNKSSGNHFSGPGLYFIDQPAIAAHGVLRWLDGTNDDKDCLVVAVVPSKTKSTDLQHDTTLVECSHLPGQNLMLGQPPTIVGQTFTYKHEGEEVEWEPWQRHVKHWMWGSHKKSPTLLASTVEGDILRYPSTIPERWLAWKPSKHDTTNPVPRPFMYLDKKAQELVFRTQASIDKHVNPHWKLVVFPQLNVEVAEERFSHHNAGNLIAVNPPYFKRKHL
eukprot:TRINITY_DN63641_c0_g1_i1.p1 TRINITY_DN63641_c0_g1~~TRINITY_DN63641_c0_g1_i1.p1  ORF type:complete len:445 (-),score=40.27 TRINITY_DN63641_c0_g1_i1:150-1484(-)